jgi:hypothetical protein
MTAAATVIQDLTVIETETEIEEGEIVGIGEAICFFNG